MGLKSMTTNQFKIGDRVAIYGTISFIDKTNDSCPSPFYYVKVDGHDANFPYPFGVSQLHSIPELARWRAEKDEIYYFVDSLFLKVKSISDTYSIVDNAHYDAHNYFATEQAAQSALDKIKQVLRENN